MDKNNINFNFYSNKWLKALIIIVLILGVFFRLTNIGKKFYRGDEIFTLHTTVGYSYAKLE
jgi:uncharacterized membrane protein